jgi:hypothetical protein
VLIEQLSNFVIGNRKPRSRLFNYTISNFPITQLFHFLMRRVLAADAAELFQLQALRHGLPVLGGRIVPLFAIAALQGNDLSGHKNSS